MNLMAATNGHALFSNNNYSLNMHQHFQMVSGVKIRCEQLKDPQ